MHPDRAAFCALSKTTARDGDWISLQPLSDFYRFSRLLHAAARHASQELGAPVLPLLGGLYCSEGCADALERMLASVSPEERAFHLACVEPQLAYTPRLPSAPTLAQRCCAHESSL
jgi:hypothetical protein